MSTSSHDSPPLFAVLIGRVSTEDDRRVVEALESLRAQDDGISHEIVIVDRRNDTVTAEIRQNYPEVNLITCAPTASLPEMRTQALHESTAPFVIVTEDHCVPPRDWLRSFRATLEAHPNAAAIAGSVENGVCDTALDWATYLCEYTAFAPPIAEGPSGSLAGMNVVYRRDRLRAIPRATLEKGFWETTAHPLLATNPDSLIASNAIRIKHCKKFSLRLFTAQRFVYSRYFAGIRFAPENRARRFAAAALSPALPPLLIVRLARAVSGHADLRAPALRALPYLLWFFSVWAVGEVAGYLLGPGDALRQIE